MSKGNITIDGYKELEKVLKELPDRVTKKVIRQGIKRGVDSVTDLDNNDGSRIAGRPGPAAIITKEIKKNARKINAGGPEFKRSMARVVRTSNTRFGNNLGVKIHISSKRLKGDKVKKAAQLAGIYEHGAIRRGRGIIRGNRFFKRGWLQAKSEALKVGASTIAEMTVKEINRLKRKHNLK